MRAPHRECAQGTQQRLCFRRIRQAGGGQRGAMEWGATVHYQALGWGVAFPQIEVEASDQER